MEASRYRPQPGVPLAQSDLQQGDAAEAIAAAEAALAQQNSASSQLDLQVIAAILNAHLKTVEGRETLDTLQQEIEAAVRTRSDLDTPAGARDFQRFLIGKLRDIRAVVANTSLDDTSKSALMAAWTSLYNASKNEPSLLSDEHRPVLAAPDAVSQQPPAPSDIASDPYFDTLALDDPGLLAAGGPASSPTAPEMPVAPALPSLPACGGGGPGPAPSWTAADGLPLSELRDRSGFDPAEKELEQDRPESEDYEDHEDSEELSAEKPDPPPEGPTTVILPDGETVTAANPQLAAAIKAAVGGTSIADAFRQQGMIIPAPGTAVSHPIESSRVVPGDIGIFTERHALALGDGKALLDGQIQPILTINGPSFLGWEHPPTPATATLPAGARPPTPTWPAAT